MGFFSKGKPSSRLPSNIVDLMVKNGRFEWDPPGSGIDGASIWSTVQEPLVPFAQSDPAGFLSALAAAVVPAGGWASYGAERLMIDLLGADRDEPGYHAVMSASLRFLRERGVPNSRMSGYEWQYWQAHDGRNEPWLPGQEAPAAVDAKITELQPGELRKVAQVTAESDSNLIFVRRDDSAGYVAVIEAKYSDDNPRRGQNDWHTSDTLHELYQRIGESFQVPTFWSADELAPYFPLARPTI